MKKVLKIAGKIVGVYIVADMAIWAIHGAAEWCRDIDADPNAPGESMSVYTVRMILDDLKTIKNCWNDPIPFESWF